MIRFETKPDPQPLPRETEDTNRAPPSKAETAVEQASDPGRKRRQARPAVDGDRLL